MGMKELEHLVSEVTGGRLTRREFVVRAAALGVSASAIGWVLAACGTKAKPKSTAQLEHLTPPATKPAKLFFYNWVDYSSPTALKDFQKTYGIEVVESYYDGNEELLAKLKAGGSGYDVILPTDFWVTLMFKTGLLHPLDMSLIPNIKYAEPAFQYPNFDPGKGTAGDPKYCVPYMFGTTGCGVRTDKVPEGMTSWTKLWDAKYKGEIDMLADSREVMAVGLFVVGKSPNSISQADLDLATKKLIEQKPLVRTYDSSNPRRNMIGGNPLTHCWDGDAVMAKRALGTQMVDYVLPQEGFMVWVDGMAIPKTAPNPYWAHKFLDFMLDPKHAADNANYIGYQSAVAATVPLIKDPIQRAMRPTSAELNAGIIPVELGNFSRQYDLAWQQIKSA
jgi:spermidine/putrescine transport system substrate-binding protein